MTELFRVSEAARDAEVNGIYETEDGKDGICLLVLVWW